VRKREKTFTERMRAMKKMGTEGPGTDVMYMLGLEGGYELIREVFD
jgi:hypothetical protein